MLRQRTHPHLPQFPHRLQTTNADTFLLKPQTNVHTQKYQPAHLLSLWGGPSTGKPQPLNPSVPSPVSWPPATRFTSSQAALSLFPKPPKLSIFTKRTASLRLVFSQDVASRLRNGTVRPPQPLLSPFYGSVIGYHLPDTAPSQDAFTIHGTPCLLYWALKQLIAANTAPVEMALRVTYAPGCRGRCWTLAGPIGSRGQNGWRSVVWVEGWGCTREISAPAVHRRL